MEIISGTPSTLPSPDLQESYSHSTITKGSAEDSVEIIHRTPNESPDIICGIPESPSSLPGSIEITDDDTSDLLMTPDEVPRIPITVPPTRNQEIDVSATVLSFSDNTLTNSETSSFYEPCKDELDHTLKATSNVMEKSIESFEVQTQVSDSTHSFEEIQHPLKKPSSFSQTEGKRDDKNEGTGQTFEIEDELETATSSDIEIISSPNCDSSSTNSCNKISPKAEFPYQNLNSESCLVDLKMERKCHSRELSEISVLSLGSDESPGSPSEMEKLLKRVSELSEILEQREYKMVQMGRTNAELVEVNTRLSQELDGIKNGRNSLDMTNVQEEYTQRLSALEKKFQQSIRENSVLKKNSESMKSEMDTKVGRDEHEKVIAEKDFVIDSLKVEGEKLSKQILQHSTITKKLRAKLKEHEEKLKKQDIQLAELTEENQKFKKVLTAKDEIEKSQSEGINKLTTDKRKFEKENQQLKIQNDDLLRKMLAMQTLHDALKIEHSDKNDEMVRNLEDAKEMAESDSRQLTNELHDLRQRMREIESASTSRDVSARQEIIELKQKLEETRFETEFQKQEASLASIPLIRQLESLQNTLNARSKLWENQEKNLLEKLDDAQNKLKQKSEGDKGLKDQVTHLELKISSLEEKLTIACRKVEASVGKLQQTEIETQLHENDYKMKIDQLIIELSNKSNEVEKFRGLVTQLEEKLRLTREDIEEEKRKYLFIQQQNQHHHHHERQDSHDLELGNASPVLSIGSVESLHSHPWNVVSEKKSMFEEKNSLKITSRTTLSLEPTQLMVVNIMVLWYNHQHH